MLRKQYLFLIVISLFLILSLNNICALDNQSDSNLSVLDNGKDVSIDCSDISMYYKDGTRFEATFTSDGEAFSNQTVYFTINTISYSKITDSDGKASIAINLQPGFYDANVCFKGDDVYNPASRDLTINISSTVISQDFFKYYKSNDTFDVYLLDSKGQYLPNTKVDFNIDGVLYTEYTDSNGKASLNLDLNPGNYTITTINSVDECFNSNSLNILPTILSEDLVKYYKGTERFGVYLLDVNGNPLSNTELSFVIRGSVYKRTTDKSGYASLAINLNPGEYSITTINSKDGCECVNEIIVLPTIISSDLVMYYHDKSQFVVTLVDTIGNPLKNTKVSFNINGRVYDKQTNSDGKASLTINLNEGQYFITSTNSKDGCEWTNEINVLPTINSTDLVKYYKNDTQFYATFLDSNGNPLKNTQVSFNINGVFYTRTTDSNGIAKLTINLLPDEYIITCTNPNDGFKSSYYITVLSTIESEDLVKKYGDDDPFIVKILDKQGNPLSNVDVSFNINGVFYTRTTDDSGFAYLNINLLPGVYTITTINPNDGLQQSNIVRVVSGDRIFYYWVRAADMNTVDFGYLSSLGTTDILLNFKAIEKIGKSGVSSWATEALSYGIRVHIWMQCFYDGSWINPVKNGEPDYELFNEIIDEALDYASIPGVAGIHLDYIRYPGTAYKTSGGTEAISTFVQMICDTLNREYPGILISAAMMPEPNSLYKYYGQDYSVFGKYLDAVIPMVYKGNYEASSSWITSVTNYFVANGQKALVLPGVQSYKSDENPVLLSEEELKNDLQAGLDAKAAGVGVFRFAFTKYIDANELIYYN